MIRFINFREIFRSFKRNSETGILSILGLTIAITIGILVAGATYLFLQREMLRIILGFILLGHAGNLILIPTIGHVGPPLATALAATVNMVLLYRALGRQTALRPA